MKKRTLTSFLSACCATMLLLSAGALMANAQDAKTAGVQAEHLPPIRHVFVLALENKNYEETFGPNTEAPYLGKTLTAEGALLTQYYGTGHNSLDNYISMMSGQGETNETSDDCNVFANFVETGKGPDGQVLGHGCVYPASVMTLANQLSAKGYTWKGYMQDMGNNPARESATCGHPPINDFDLTQEAQAPSPAYPLGDKYATRHDPYMYFHSIIDSPACKTNVVSLPALKTDLESIETTPNFSFITPNLCDDGHNAPCTDGQPGGLKSINSFLQEWVPLIMNSPAYKKDGLLIITFDEGGTGKITHQGKQIVITVPGASCCHESKSPNLHRAYPEISHFQQHGVAITERTLSYGGDRTGTVLLSPYIRPGTVSNVPYNHYSLLKSLEQIFGIQQYLGYAGQKGLVPFGSDIYTNYKQ